MIAAALRSIWARDITLALLGGFAVTLAFPPNGHAIAVIPALIVVTWRLDACSPWRAASIGWAFGIGWHFGALSWIAEALLVPMPYLGLFAQLPILALSAAFALFFAIPFYLWRRFWPGAGMASAASRLGLAAMLSLSEWAYGHVLTGFAWDLTALGFTETRLIHAAAYFGAYGVGLLIFSTALAISGAIRARTTHARWGSRDIIATALPVLLLAWAWIAPNPGAREAPPEDAITIRMVQGNTPQRIKWQPQNRGIIFNRHAALSTKAGVPKPELIIWPETATPFNVLESPVALERISALAADDGFVILGTPLRTRRPNGSHDTSNSMVAINSAGQLAGRYDKSHLVPFGEYMPLASIVPYDRLVPGQGSFTPGSGPITLQLGALPSFSPLICYEIIFPGAVTAGTRPDFLLNITNDAWYGQSAGPHQHLAIARMRAIEEGLPLIRVANTGISAAMDGYGNVLASIPLETAGAVDVKLPAPLPPTLYARFGDLIFAGMLAFVLAFSLLLGSRSRAGNII